MIQGMYINSVYDTYNACLITEAQHVYRTLASDCEVAKGTYVHTCVNGVFNARLITETQHVY